MDGLALCQHVKEDVAETDVRCKCDPHNPTACPQLRHEAKRSSNTQVADRCIHRRVCLPQGLFGRAMHDPLITYCLLPLGQLYSPRDQHPVPAIIDLLLPRWAPTHPRCNQVNPGFPNKRQVHEYLVNSHLDYDIPNSDVGNSPVGVIFNPLGHFLDAIASPCNWCCQWASGPVSGVIISDLQSISDCWQYYSTVSPVSDS